MPPARTESRVPPDTARLDPHPEPPDDLSRLSLPFRVTNQAWFRMHRLVHDPLYFGRSGIHRFDAPADEYGVLYVGDSEHCAFIETFGHTTGLNIVAMSELRARGLARIEVGRPLRLVDLTGPGLGYLGVDARLTGGDDYGLAQRWALALHTHPDQPDGHCYRSRHDPSRVSAAIFDRASDAVTATSLGSLADARHLSLLANLLETYRFGLMD